MIGRLLSREDTAGVASRMLLGVLAVGALALAGCGVPLDGLSDQPTAPAPAPTPKSISVDDPHGLHAVKPVYEGTELLCIKDTSYNSLECNWELWNMTREKKE